MDAKQKAQHFIEKPLRPGRPGARLKGSLIIIGGHEDRKGEKKILSAVAERLGRGGKIVVCTAASAEPAPLWEEYERAFRALGVAHVYHLSIDSREEAMDGKALRVLEGASGVFFTGGDQLKITSMIGDSPVYSRVLEIFENGGVIAGTSAGASVMSETMLVGSDGDGSYKIKSALLMAPGFGFAKNLLVDQHFAERGRMARLIGAVTQNPRVLGVGIDENTSIIISPGARRFQVLGEGAVYVVDGGKSTYSNMGEEDSDRTLSAFDIAVHMMSQGDVFDLATRRPHAHPADTMEDSDDEEKSEAADE